MNKLNRVTNFFTEVFQFFTQMAQKSNKVQIKFVTLLLMLGRRTKKTALTLATYYPYCKNYDDSKNNLL